MQEGRTYRCVLPAARRERSLSLESPARSPAESNESKLCTSLYKVCPNFHENWKEVITKFSVNLEPNLIKVLQKL